MWKTKAWQQGLMERYPGHMGGYWFIAKLGRKSVGYNIDSRSHNVDYFSNSLHEKNDMFYLNIATNDKTSEYFTHDYYAERYLVYQSPDEFVHGLYRDVVEYALGFVGCYGVERVYVYKKTAETIDRNFIAQKQAAAKRAKELEAELARVKQEAGGLCYKEDV